MPSSDTSPDKTRRVLVILRKIIVRTVLAVLLLLIAVIALIQFPAIQNYLKDKVVTSLSNKLQSTVKLGYIRINFRGSLVLEDLFIADRQNDTVINARKIKVAVNPLGLFRKKLVVSNVSISETNFNYLILDNSGRTNLDFIINSFASSEKEKEKPESKGGMDIQIRKVQLLKSNFVYHNLNDSMSFKLGVGRFLVNISENNLDSMSFDVDRVLLQNTKVNLTSYKLSIKDDVTNTSKKVAEKQDTTKGLTVSLRKLDLIAVTFEQTDSLTRSGGIYTIGEAHIIPDKIDLTNQIINIASFEIKKGNINYKAASSAQTSTVKEQIASAPTKDKDWKIVLNKGKFQFDKVKFINPAAAGGSLGYLADISLSNLNMDVAAEFANPKSWNVDLNSLRVEDDRTSKLISIVITANAQGDKISVSPFNIRLGNSHISGMAQGNFLGGKKGALPEFNANISSSNIIITDFEPYLPKSMYATLNRIPSQMGLFAKLESSNQVLHGKGELKTSEGDIGFKAQMSQGTTSSYAIDVDLKGINGAFFTQNQQVGKLTASINASGSGFKPDSMKTDFSIVIPTMGFKGIIYNNVKLNGNINYGQVKAKLITSDPFAKLTLNVNGNLGDQPTFKVNTHVFNLDLNKMKLIEDTISISGVIDATYANLGDGRFKAITDTLLLNVRTVDKEIDTDSKLSYTVLGDTVEARVESNFGKIAYDGNLPLQEVAAVMKNYFQQYFSKEKSDSAQLSTNYFKLAVNIKDLSLVRDFLDINIDVPEDANITAELRDNHLVSNVDIEKIIFNEIEVDNLSLAATGRDSSFLIDFKTSAIHNNVHTLRDVSLSSNLRDGDLETRLEISNSESQKWFNIGLSLQPQNPELNVVIREPLMLNHEDWNVDENNRTYVQNKNIVFSNVKLSNKEKLISLLSDARQPEKLAVSFKNLDLKILSEILNNDTTFISGKIDGDLMATNLFAKPVPVFDAKLGISNIIVEKQPLGDLNVSASNTQNNDIAFLNVYFGLTDMKFNLDGTYGLQKDIPMDLNLNTQNLSLAAIQPLLKELITDASGAVNASINVKGNFADPEVNGNISFDKASAFIEPIQSKFSIDQQRINFRGNGIDFNKFTVKDADGSNLEIDGKIELADLKNLRYNLNIKSDKFLAYQGPPDNIPGQDNKVILTSDLKITGENKAPQVNATMMIEEGSRFFYKITKQASNLTEEGVIEFIGPEQIGDTEEKKQENAPETSVIENLNLAANLNVAKYTAVTIITDPVRNLGLNMEAGGVFTLDQRPFQAPRLNGTLEISGGDYTMSLSGIKRKFQIADSSYIVWYGNIAEPELDLRAYYEVRTSPAELLNDPKIKNTLPFMVNMLISGSLDDPQFSFRLSLPQEYEGAYDGIVAAKLQELNSNESELNQNAMTLLLFGSFGFNNFANLFASGGGANVIISNALNQFAAQKIKFVELHFDLQSYDDYGGTSQDNLRTEMEIAASKKFVDERLNVELGATVVLQADELEQEQSIADRISPEFNIEYLINKPRTLSLRTFRRSEYRGLVEGKVISTGAGILYQKDFDKFSQMFGKKPDESESVTENLKDVNEKK